MGLVANPNVVSNHLVIFQMYPNVVSNQLVIWNMFNQSGYQLCLTMFQNTLTGTKGTDTFAGLGEGHHEFIGARARVHPRLGALNW